MPLQEEFEKQGNFLFRYRSILPLFILIVGLAVYVFTILDAKNTGRPIYSDTYEIICLAVSLFGLFVRVYSVGHTPSDTSGRNRTRQIAEELNTTGIYSAVRHPLYLGNFLMWLGVGMLSQNLWFIVSFIILYAFYYERIMYAEEQFLRRKFGDTYIQWGEKTPAFIPSFSHWKSPKYPFSFSKVIRKEKNGIVAIFLLFLIFDAVKAYLIYNDYNILDSYWFYAAILSGVYYLMIKILKKTTKIFN